MLIRYEYGTGATKPNSPGWKLVAVVEHDIPGTVLSGLDERPLIAFRAGPDLPVYPQEHTVWFKKSGEVQILKSKTHGRWDYLVRVPVVRLTQEEADSHIPAAPVGTPPKTAKPKRDRSGYKRPSRSKAAVEARAKEKAKAEAKTAKATR